MRYEQNRSYNGGGVVYVLKVRHLDQHDSIQKAGHFASHFYLQKRCTLRYVFISKIYRYILTPNNKRTYYQSDQINK